MEIHELIGIHVLDFKGFLWVAMNLKGLLGKPWRLRCVILNHGFLWTSLVNLVLGQLSRSEDQGDRIAFRESEFLWILKHFVIVTGRS